MKKPILTSCAMLLSLITNSYAFSVIQVNFHNQSTCPVEVEIHLDDLCSSGTPWVTALFTVVPGSSTPTYYAPSGQVILKVNILDGSATYVVGTVDFCADDLVTGTFNNGCDDMYAFGSGNCCGANPDIRDIGLSVL